jgi:serine/threonine protein kinase
MDKFQVVKNLGDGTYGTVVEAVNKLTREKVAIKKLKRKFSTWDECMALREIKMLRKLSHHNVIKLKEVIREQNSLYLIFEHVDGTVLDLIRESKRLRGNKGLKEDTIRHVVSQCLKGM